MGAVTGAGGAEVVGVGGGSEVNGCDHELGLTITCSTKSA